MSNTHSAPYSFFEAWAKYSCNIPFSMEKENLWAALDQHVGGENSSSELTRWTNKHFERGTGFSWVFLPFPERQQVVLREKSDQNVTILPPWPDGQQIVSREKLRTKHNSILPPWPCEQQRVLNKQNVTTSSSLTRWTATWTWSTDAFSLSPPSSRLARASPLGRPSLR